MDVNVQVTEKDIYEALGPEEAKLFMSIMNEVEKILNNPETLVGNSGAILAAKLAAFRTKIGLLGQIYKTKEKSIVQRRRKDLMLTMFTALEENIQTLKLLSRLENSSHGR